MSQVLIPDNFGTSARCHSATGCLDHKRHAMSSLGTSSHTLDFMRMGLNICQFGCQQGLVDALARLTEHYQGNKCFEPDLITGKGDISGYSGCRYPRKANDAGGTHWVDIHGCEAYEDSKIPCADAPEVEGVFERGWRWAINKVFGKLAKRDDSLILKTKRVFAFVDEDFRLRKTPQDGMKPSDHLLQLDQCSVSAGLNRLLNASVFWGPEAIFSQPNGDHLIFIFRESACPGPHEKIVKLFWADATQTAKNIHLSGLAQAKSYELVSSIEVKGSMIPSFVDDIETEMALASGAISSLNSLPTKVKNTFVTTVRLKQQITYAHLLQVVQNLSTPGLNVDRYMEQCGTLSTLSLCADGCNSKMHSFFLKKRGHGGCLKKPSLLVGITPLSKV